MSTVLSDGQSLTGEDFPTLLITPPNRWIPLQLSELWEYRELLYFLVWRDIKVRYKQTALGAAWAVMQPLFMMLVFSLFFGRLAKIPSDGIPYPVFTFCALIPWQQIGRASCRERVLLLGVGAFVLLLNPKCLA